MSPEEYKNILSKSNNQVQTHVELVIKQLNEPTKDFLNKIALLNNQKISKKNLKNNIELNIRTSMKLLHQLHNRYGNWKLVCGYYNTGRPIVNGYASFCVNNKNYQKNWVYIKGV